MSALGMVNGQEWINYNITLAEHFLKKLFCLEAKAEKNLSTRDCTNMQLPILQIIICGFGRK